MATNQDVRALRLRQKPVRITIPAAVAYDLKALQKGIASLVERLGCKPCFSGADCLFHLESEFVINEKAEVSADPSPNPWVQAGGLATSPVPDPWFQSSHATVRLPGKVSYNLEQVQKLVANIAGRIGHPGCFSGFDFLFQHEKEFLIDEALNIRTP
jgi:hypothetical protein